jgi:hypothetical protein
MRRRNDGTYEAIDWETAITEIAQKFLGIKERHGGESILYYGGANQGSHLGGTYADSTQKALGIKFRSNALAQEKTGEFWVGGKMLTAGAHGDFEHCEVAVFVGKNPWHSHGFARTRVVLREIQKDPDRSLIVIDPRRSETAAMADFHLATRPGTDAWCRRAGRRSGAGGPGREGLAGGPHDGLRAGRASAAPDRHFTVRLDLRCGRRPAAPGRKTHRAGAECVDDGRPGRADERALHAQQLPAAPGLAADGQLRARRHQQCVRALPEPRQAEQGRGSRVAAPGAGGAAAVAGPRSSSA